MLESLLSIWLPVRVVWAAILSLVWAGLLLKFLNSEQFSQWAIPVRSVLLVLGVAPTLLLSSLITLALQLFAHSLLFLPFSQRLRLSQLAAGMYWDSVSFSLALFTGGEYRMCVERMSMDGVSGSDLIELLSGRLSGNVLCLVNNELSELDWLATLSLWSRLGRGAGQLHLLDTVFAMVTPLGWILQLSGSLMSYRNDFYDLPRLKKQLPNVVKSYPKPYVFQTSVERAGMAQAGILTGQLRYSLSTIVDITICRDRLPTLPDLIRDGRVNRTTDMYVRFIDPTSLPESQDSLDAALLSLTAEKEQIYERLKRNETIMTTLRGGRANQMAVVYALSVMSSAMLMGLGFGFPIWLTLIWMVTALFPIWLVFLQFESESEGIVKTVMDGAEQKLSTMMSSLKQTGGKLLEKPQSLIEQYLAAQASNKDRKLFIRK